MFLAVLHLLMEKIDRKIVEPPSGVEQMWCRQHAVCPTSHRVVCGTYRWFRNDHNTPFPSIQTKAHRINRQCSLLSRKPCPELLHPSSYGLVLNLQCLQVFCTNSSRARSEDLDFQRYCTEGHMRVDFLQPIHEGMHCRSQVAGLQQ